mmetsp:Transcript_22587/g.40043  ORF Transcript_22587/g.40043 Transcript_22587/m.40043 type:complete len:324 (-) Transcript_22587:168-1139(-)|eukprot:CAMPEP_0184514242 /NCGR_PEP_ID=MMETSP0198_2-20121128/3859_1 /TAXON_ID=1112570 /ORGANISM="Thraustochytrium sp., Strain LLF1b" /LENGTH=323 /DNA_ID=CAMNT_0026904419 /DNA_START=127 /DNA_END=1098 /DNA_ORIENTATION=+
MADQVSSFVWSGSHILSVHDLDQAALITLFKTADRCRAAVLGENGADLSLLECCKHKILGLVFYEPSTRTNCSFAAAMLRLGGTYLNVNESSSSVKKGETLQDTLRCLECYCDVLVLRHPEKGSVAGACSYLQKPILNAGDGAGEHPTQAMLDLYTILREQGNKIDGLVITMVGDLKFGRTTHSLAQLLAKYNVTINYVTPPGLEMPDYVKEAVAQRGHASQNDYNELEAVLPGTDVLYVTRVQKERFPSVEEYEKVNGSFIITPATLENAKSTLTIMHPLPRVGEITEDVDSFPSAAYFRQMENGMYLRMALIGLVLNVIKP